MPKFVVHTHVKNGFESFAFAPGQEVPDWAIEKVGSHVHDDANLTFPEPAAEPVDLIAVEPVSEVVAEPEVPESEPEKVEPAAEPDFTQPAPAKRGRPRKAE